MGVKDAAITVTLYLWDTGNNAYKTGDGANLTLRLQSDGVEATPSNSPTEVDSTNMPGAYDLVITAGENDGRTMTLGGKSSTADIIVIPLTWMNEIDAVNAVETDAASRTASKADVSNLDAAVSTRATPAQVATELATYDGPTNAEMEARTLLAADYFDPATDEVTTDAASRTASKADVSALATEAKQDIIDTVVDAIKAKTDGLNFTGNDVQAIMDAAALALFATTDTGETTAAAGSVAKIAQGTASLTAAAVADAVWDEAAADHTTASTFGKFLGYLDGTFTTLITAIWAHATRTLTQSAASVAAVVSGSDITVTRGDDWSIALTGLGDVTNYGDIWFTVKEAKGDADTAAIVQIDTDTGLLYLDGAVGTAGNGSITVDDASAGDITIALVAADSATLTPRAGLHYDVQWQNAGGTIATLTTGELTISGDVTRATS